MLSDRRCTTLRYVVLSLVFAIQFLGFAYTGYAQGGVDSTGTGGQHSISGRLIFPSGQRADVRLKVRLESPGTGDLTVISDSNGYFGFRSLKPGSYTVVVEGDEFFEGERETVFIEPVSAAGPRGVGIVPVARPFTVQIYLRAKRNAAVQKPEVINAALAGVPKAAADLYIQAMDSFAKGETDKGIGQLKQALILDPTFGLALNELGVQYLKRGDVPDAERVLESAVKVSPQASAPRLNYGVALLNGGKYSEAEIQFREVVKLNEAIATAHMYLGIALVKLKRYSEAETELQHAISLDSDKVGPAHYYLGGLYWRARNYSQAAAELEAYLKLEPNAPNARQIRATISELRQK